MTTRSAIRAANTPPTEPPLNDHTNLIAHGLCGHKAQLRVVHADRAERGDGRPLRAEPRGAARFPVALRGSVVHGAGLVGSCFAGDHGRDVLVAGAEPAAGVDAGGLVRAA